MRRTQTAVDARRLGTALAFFAAGALIFVGFVTTPWEGNADTASYLSSLRDNPAQAQLSAVLLHFGYLLAVPALLGVLPLVRGRGVVVVHVGALLMALGFATFSGLVASDFWSLSMAQNLPLEAAVDASDGTDRLGGLTAVAVPAFIGLLLGTPLFAFGAWRSRLVAWPVPICLVTAVAVMTIAGPNLVLNALGSGLMLIAFSSLGWKAARLGQAASSTPRQPQDERSVEPSLPARSTA